MAICLGLNDGVFPATPQPGGLFSEAERQQLTEEGFTMGGRLRESLAQEQFYGYIAFTRPRNHLVVTCSRIDSKGKTAHPSVFIQKLKRLLPNLKVGAFDQANVAADLQHDCELLPLLLPDSKRAINLASHSVFARQIEALSWCRVEPVFSPLPAGLADRLYGNPLHTSVSKFEDFPACPFKFFVRSGLNAKERKTFELDSKQQGSFQHKLLELFHKDLQKFQLRWRDLQPMEARQRIRNIAEKIIPEFGGGIMIAKPENQFLAHIYTGLIEDFVAQIIAWMQQQWLFDPVEVEIGFGNDEELGLWPIELPNGKKVTFHGRIDRIDLWRDPDGTTRYVVIDYKSGGKRLTKALFERGMEQQLSVYMLAIKGSQRAHELLKSDKLEPAGGFFVSLRPDFGSGKNRNEVLEENDSESSESYKHYGLFDFSRIDQLDRIGRRDQIKYRVNKDPRKLHGGTAFGAKYAEDFSQSLAKNEQQLREMAARVFDGEIAIHPFKLGGKVACERCDFACVCRFDSWRDDYNVLK
jgi:ATP-dependent helicase/nuclease subunit B